jgi:hypothetical protein
MTFRTQCKNLGLKCTLWLSPVLDDKNAVAGITSGHYFHADLLVARRIYQRNPRVHIDVGSRLDGFVAHVASFREIIVMDIRSIENVIPNVTFLQSDVMDLDKRYYDCCDSLSCLHALEHFGLGRYGDRIDIDGHIKGLDNLRKMLELGGILYLAVPIGPGRIEFNNQRVFDLSYLLDLVKARFDIVGFSLIDDAGNLHVDIPLDKHKVAQNFYCWYGCAVVELVKR